MDGLARLSCVKGYWVELGWIDVVRGRGHLRGVGEREGREREGGREGRKGRKGGGYGGIESDRIGFWIESSLILGGSFGLDWFLG